ncbi:ATP-dependent DNA helicase DinG [Niallia sp. Krafla_26]|uniref:ATP-dependent DNA helicase DinG n=1 Tax=Niallia sp. Krafla_26 TaxID=3064703 RepID=UPI003D178F1E
MCNRYVVVDLETTGNSVKKGDRIIQFAAVVVENGSIIDCFSTIINPEQPIPIFIEELTGINDEMVKDAPVFSEVAPRIVELLQGAYFVAHNVLFDISFLQDELIMAGYDGFYGSVLDTVEMARILLPTSDSFKLSDLALQEGLQHERPHQADSDAYVTAELLIILFNHLRCLPLATLKQLYPLSHGLKSDLNEIIEELIIKKESSIEKMPYDLEKYNGLYIRKIEQEDVKEESLEIQYPFDEEIKEQLLSKLFPSYEKRSGQFQMMDLIFQSFQDEQHALIEAGTGVGKSLGYLIPAIFHAKLKRKPVIISTYTTQLQEQLLTKEIPLLNRVLPFSFKTVIMKGKSHYLNLDRFALSLQDFDDNYDTTLTKMQILVWLTRTIAGDKDELNLSSGGQLFWQRIQFVDRPFVNNKGRNQFDFYLKSRRSALNADIIIVNHSLLLTDMRADEKMLPASDYFIIDEGHHLEKTAGKYFGLQFDYATVRYLLQQLGLFEQKQLLFKIEQIVGNSQKKDFVSQTKLNEKVSQLLFEMDQLFNLISMYAKKRRQQKSHTYPSSIQCLLTFDHTKESQAVIGEAERFLFLLLDVTNALKKRYEWLVEKEHKTVNQKAILDELTLWIQKAEKIIYSIRMLFIQPSSENVSWIEIDTRSRQNRTTVFTQPIHASTGLKEHFFEKKKSVIVTSATLSIKGSLKYMMERLGLDSTTCSQAIIPTSFDYQKQLQLIVSKDLPEVNAVSLEEYVSAIGEHIISIAEATKGRLLILFTSYEMLKQTHDLIKESGFLQDYSILAHGISSGSRERLIRNFQRFDKAILFGTSSFWEGIDIPGDDLSGLIIVRLPFSPPDDPITAVRSQQIKANGGNSFYEYSLPEAVIRFKQGFGRLIRSNQDKGVMIIFDQRIISTQYGKVFLQSLPVVRTNALTIDETVRTIEQWLK